MGTPIEAGAEITKDWWPPAKKAESSTDILNLTNTTWQPGTPEVGTTFTAPLSGKVAVALVGHGVQQATQDRIFFSYRIYLGTSTAGTLYQEADTHTGVSSSGTTSAGAEFGRGHLSMVEGLTPLSTYYAVVVHMIEGAGTTSDVAFRRIIVFPVP
jgi:hypothetical protein